MKIDIEEAKIVFLYKEDLEGDVTKVVRSLITHPELNQSYLLPIKEEETTLIGIEISWRELDLNPWVLTKQTPWQSQKVPTGLREQTIIFQSHAQIQEVRKEALARELPDILNNERALFDRVSRLEYLDCILGGNIVSTAALLILAQENPDDPVVGHIWRLKNRCIALSPDSTALKTELNSKPFQSMNQIIAQKLLKITN